MLNLCNSVEFVEKNQQSVNILHRAITLSQGQFSLILVSCNHSKLRNQAVKQLRAISTVEIQEIVLTPSTQTLFSTILNQIFNQQPQALMVFGLDAIIDIDTVLISTNLVRNEFSKQFQFPIVLWINEAIMHRMIRLVPDFKSWAGNTIRLS